MNETSVPMISENPALPESPGWRRRIMAWVQLISLPLLAIALMGIVFLLIGYGQRVGWISKPESLELVKNATINSGVRYICPMMCVEPTLEPGRCPVCEMELVPAETGPVYLDPATRRILNIQTVKVTPGVPTREIRTVGELTYDEAKLRTISAYFDSRIEKLYANYTGVEVTQGETLAVVYSPQLQVAQRELLLAKNSRSREVAANDRLYAQSRQRLIEWGVSSQQIEALEQSGDVNSRLELVAPMSGTVIEKLAVEGQYITQGEPIYRLANLSQVWLMLKLFPEEATLLKIGQRVEAEVDSLPGQIFEGRVEFIVPSIDPSSRTVDVRVVMPNPRGLLRVGDFARANCTVTMESRSVADSKMASMATDDRSATDSNSPLVVPRDSVLIVGRNSVVYVETEPGRFEMRTVTIHSISHQQVFISDGLKEGELVARRGNFLIDSQMQLAGNPSLIDPSRAVPKPMESETTLGIDEAMAALSPEDRELAMSQKLCVVADMPLGSMGVPIRVDIHGEPVFICCEGCRASLIKQPDKYLDKLKK
jgi:membrane fusion protein, copper/silver efflux system